MQAGADIVDQLQFAAVRRRAPLWLDVLLPWCVLLSPIGIAACIGWAVWDYRRLERHVARHWTGWIDAAVPALEDSSALLDDAVTPLAKLQRARLLKRLHRVLREDVIASIAWQHVRFDRRLLALSLLLALAVAGWRYVGVPTLTPAQSVAKMARHIDAQTSRIDVRITPPRYSNAAPSTHAPADLRVPQYSTVEWCLQSPQPVDTPVELSDGQRLVIGRQCARWSATETVFWRWRGQRHVLRVLADAPPTVQLRAPATLAPDATEAPITVSVQDDYRVQRAVLHLTLARASGDTFLLGERDMALPDSGDARVRQWTRQWPLEELGMEPGDTLYLSVRATDNADNPHTVVSPIATLRWPSPNAGQASAPASGNDENPAADGDIAAPDLAGVRSARRIQSGADDAASANLRALLVALSASGPLPKHWSDTAHAAIRAAGMDDDTRLAAQRVLQDVGDGCLACRAPLRASLRSAMVAAPGAAATPLKLQATQVAVTPFTRAFERSAP